MGNGLLSGKYSATSRPEDLPDGRIAATAAHTPPETDKRTERSWRIVAELDEVAKKVGQTPAQVAVNSVANRPAVGTVILGATKPHQLQETITSVDFTLPTALRDRLDEVSAPPPAVPYSFLPWLHGRINADLTAKRPGYFGQGR